MSTSIVATAPGKVVLSGEYAVLDCAPAICMAINYRARATIVLNPRGMCLREANFNPQTAEFDGRLGGSLSLL